MQQMDCINQQACERGLTKRSQAERLVIADSLIASVWKEYLNGSIDRSNLQLAAYIQTNVNRIVWKLNELNNPNTPNTLEALDCIDRQAAIDAQPEPCEYYALCRHGRDENKLRERLGFCEYCNEDADGYVKPIEKNCHAFIRFGMDGWEISLSAKGWNGSAKIMYCPMCGRRLKNDK